MRTLLALTLALPAAAHTLQVTGVTLKLDATGTTVTVVAHAPMLAGADPASGIAGRLKLRLDNEPFQPSNITIKRDSQYDTVTWSATSPARATDQATLDAPIFPDHPDDTTIVLVYRNGELIEKTALNSSHPSATVAESTWTVVRRFGEMGVHHILSGADHILFLCGLILVGGPLLRLVGVVTAFTLAHSLTLSLTALGISSLSPRFVEPMIAASIVIVALENLWRKQKSVEFRVWLAFGFGFFHGFGFAGALTEAGLPGHAIAWSLAAFNVGVELGQGLILVLMMPALNLLARRSEPAFQLATRTASWLIAAAGVIWFAERILA